MKPDGGSSVIPDVIEPGAWLLAYWMGRYHGFITPPEVADPTLLQVDRNRNIRFGAQPYAGPLRSASFKQEY